jgi:ribosomal protein S18 acetylase RimI-like enzyme
MSLQIRPSGPGDQAVITRLIKELADAGGEESPITEGYVTEYFSNPGSHVLLADQDGQTIGLLSYSIRPDLYHAGPTALIEELVVQASERGRGVGSALLEELFRGLARLGVVEVSVSTMPDNQRARRFYQAHGLVDEAVFLERHL